MKLKLLWTDKETDRTGTWFSQFVD